MKNKSNLADRMLGKTTFLVGNKKNAGKTTFLNYALERLRPMDAPVLITIGVDGESRDLVFNRPKPKIAIKEQDFVVTTDAMLNRSDAKFEILHVFPFKTKLGRMLLARTLRKGFVELVGSEDNHQLQAIIDFHRREMNLNSIVVDGAVNRKTQVAGTNDSHFMYILKVEGKRFKEDVQQFKKISMASRFPSFNEVEIFSTKRIFVLKGALTAAKTHQIPRDTEILLLEDFTKIFIDYPALKRLSERLKIAFKQVYQLEAFIVILKDITKATFEKSLTPVHLQEHIVYNPYEY